MNDNRRKATEYEERINLLRAERDYEYCPDIFEERDERIVAMLRILWHDLTKEERRLLLLFAECGSNCSKTARQLGVTPPTVAAAIKNIRTKILSIYDRQCNKRDGNDM